MCKSMHQCAKLRYLALVQTEIEKDHIEDHELIALIKAGVDMSGLQGIGEAIPWLSFLDRWFILPTAKLKQIKRQLNNYYYKTIQEHRLHREATPDPHDQGKPRDFVDVLLDITPADMDGAAVTDDTIACQIGVSMRARSMHSFTSTAYLDQYLQGSVVHAYKPFKLKLACAGHGGSRIGHNRHDRGMGHVGAAATTGAAGAGGARVGPGGGDQ